MPTPLVTLTTDFGSRDPYVAAMKGVIFSIQPRLTIMDLSHEIAPRDILEGSLFLAGAIPYFPEHTVHVAVVDPGVGMQRHPIIIYAGDRYLVSPDNGIATCYIRQFPVQDIRVIENERFMHAKISPTFHGRDIFAHAAAHLARGVPLHEFGPELERAVELDIPEPEMAPKGITGEVIHVDRFGNLITNIQQGMLPDASPIHIEAGSYRLDGLHRTYGEVPMGVPLALIGSTGLLEIAVSGGDASALLGIGRGQGVVVVLDA